MKKEILRKEKGSVEVEATIILPIAILSVILLLYLALFMFQRAHLQASLETALVYYKSTLTDTFVTKNDKLTQTMVVSSAEGDDSEEDKVTVVIGGADGNAEATKNFMASGNSYTITDGINPYRGMFGDEYDIGDDSAFTDYFFSVAGNLMFQDTLDVKIDYDNYVLFKQIKASAVQTVDSPIDFSILGVGNTFTVSVTAKMNVIDYEDTVRNVDYAIDIIEETKLGKAAQDFATKCGELYTQLTDKLGVERP